MSAKAVKISSRSPPRSFKTLALFLLNKNAFPSCNGVVICPPVGGLTGVLCLMGLVGGDNSERGSVVLNDGPKLNVTFLSSRDWSRSITEIMTGSGGGLTDQVTFCTLTWRAASSLLMSLYNQRSKSYVWGCTRRRVGGADGGGALKLFITVSRLTSFQLILFSLKCLLQCLSLSVFLINFVF